MLSVNETTINNLSQVANLLDETTDSLLLSVKALNSSFEENKDALGPHVEEIRNILEELKRVETESEKAVTFISHRLRTLIPKYEEILNRRLGTP